LFRRNRPPPLGVVAPHRRCIDTPPRPPATLPAARLRWWRRRRCARLPALRSLLPGQGRGHPLPLSVRASGPAPAPPLQRCCQKGPAPAAPSALRPDVEGASVSCSSAVHATCSRCGACAERPARLAGGCTGAGSAVGRGALAKGGGLHGRAQHRGRRRPAARAGAPRGPHLRLHRSRWHLNSVYSLPEARDPLVPACRCSIAPRACAALRAGAATDLSAAVTDSPNPMELSKAAATRALAAAPRGAAAHAPCDPGARYPGSDAVRHHSLVVWVASRRCQASPTPSGVRHAPERPN
jgi:hypothetical protein